MTHFLVVILASFLLISPVRAMDCDLSFYLEFDLQQPDLKHRQRLHDLFVKTIARQHKNMHEINLEAGDMFQSDLLHGPQLVLKIASFNTGLLYRLGGLASVPEYQLRFKLMLSQVDYYLRKEKPAFLLLQEVWDLRDGREIERIAGLNGYESFFAETSGNTNPYGMQTLVRRDLIAGRQAVQDLGVVQARPQFVEVLAGLKKGIFPLGITLADGTRILLFNTHFPYSPQRTRSRLLQARSLSDMVKAAAPNIDYVMVGGDFNSSDRFASDFDPVATNWYKDSTVYLGFLEDTKSSGLRDAYAAMFPGSEGGFTQDPNLNSIARTGTTTKDEPAQRIDYLFVGSHSRPKDHFWVKNARLIFASAVGNDKKINISDHFGTEAEVVVIGQHRG